MTKLFQFTLIWTLIIQIGFGTSSFLVFASEESNDSERIPGFEAPADLSQQAADLIAKHPETIGKHVAAVSDLADKIEATNEGDMPGPSPDTMHWGNVSIITYNKAGEEVSTRDLDKIDLDKVPLAVSMSNFDTEVVYRMNADTKSFDICKKSGAHILACYRMENLDVISYHHDKDYMILITRDGKVHAMSRVLLKLYLFKARIPLFRLALPGKNGGLSASTEGYDSINMTFATEGLKPFETDEIDSNAHIDQPEKNYSYGNLYVYGKKDGKRTLLGAYDRTIIYQQLADELATLALLSLSVSEGNAAYAEKVSSLIKSLNEKPDDLTIRQEILDRIKTRQEQSQLNKFLAAIPQAEIDKLSTALDHLQGIQKLPRGVAANLAEWKASSTELIELAKKLQAETATAKGRRKHVRNADPLAYAIGSTSRAERPFTEDDNKLLAAAIEDNDVGSFYQDLINYKVKQSEPQASGLYKFISADTLNSIAKVTLYGGTAFLAGSIALSQTGAWGVSLINNIRNFLVPDVFNDAAYRSPLIKSTLIWMAQLLTTMGVFGGIAKLNGWGWNYKKAIVTTSLRLYSVLSYPFHLLFYKALGQTNFNTALRNGINPFQKVKEDSTVGQSFGLMQDARPGINNPLNPLINPTAIQKNRDLIEQLTLRKRHTQSLAFLLANIVIAKKHKIDLPTLVTLQQEGWSQLLKDKGFAELSKNEDFFENQAFLSQVISVYLASQSKLEVDLQKISVEDLAKYIESASSIAKRMEDSKSVKDYEKSKAKWASMQDKIFRYIGNYGSYHSQFLKNLSSSPLAETLVFRQFWVDWVWMCVQESTVGARADLSDPANLYAKDDAPMWTNWENGSGPDRIQQWLVYTLIVGQRYELVYGATLDLESEKEKSYSPRDSIATNFTERKQSAISLMKHNISNLFNFRKLQHGKYAFRDLKRKAEFWQAGLLMDLPIRMILAGRSFSHAVGGWALTQIGAYPSMGFLWNIVNRTTGIAEAEFEEDFLTFKNSLASATQAIKLVRANADSEELRKKYSEEIKTNVESLIKLFIKDSLELPKDLQNTLAQAENKLNIDSKDQLSGRRNLMPYVSAVLTLKDILEDASITDEAQRVQALQEAYKHLELLYKGGHSLLTPNEAELLVNYARVHSPVNTRMSNAGKEAMTLIFGAAPTTYIGVLLFVHSYSATVMSKIAYLLPRVIPFYAGVAALDYVSNKIGAITDKIRQHKVAEIQELYKKPSSVESNGDKVEADQGLPTICVKALLSPKDHDKGNPKKPVSLKNRIKKYFGTQSIFNPAYN